MKFLSISLTLISTLALLSFSPIMHGDGTYKADVTKSNIEWVGKKFSGEHSGTLSLASGEIVMGGHGIASANFVIDMTSIKCTDLSGEKASDLEGHLKDDDFFGTEKFPNTSIDMLSAKPLTGDKDGNNFTIKANLTIKDITNEISFPAQIKIGDKQVTVDAKVVFDRTKWDIKYKSKTVFDDLGDKFIYDDINLIVSVVADLQ